MSVHETYMQRCLQLAGLGAGNTAPNPMVGSVLVHDNEIIGEGYHEQYGGPHAEVNCISDAEKRYHQRVERNFSFEQILAESTIYVSLEPCAHYGKTPPCADLIISRKIPHAVVGCRDPFPLVDGKGIEKLKDAGVMVETGILEKECQEINGRFFTFHQLRRPYIILKWAQSNDRFIAANSASRTYITNEITNRLVHQWRHEAAAILVGTKTALADDPSLTNRLWFGKQPVRLVIDLKLRLPDSLRLFSGGGRTIVFNFVKEGSEESVQFIKLDQHGPLARQICDALFERRIQSLIIEGGAETLQTFINEDLWDEARVITNRGLFLQEGIRAPKLKDGLLIRERPARNDSVEFYKRSS